MKFLWNTRTTTATAPQKARPPASRAATAARPADPPADEKRSQVFVSRTPILTRERQVSAYALHFHSAPAQGSAARLSDYTSARVISDGILQIGLDTLASGRKVYVTVSRRLLLGGIPDLLPPHRVIIQLSSDIEGEAEVIEACQGLRKSGYAMAIDDFTINEWTNDLVPLAMYVKVDWKASTPESRAAVLARRTNQIPAVIAKNVDTEEAFQAARAEGFTYFQGPFFGLPSTSTAQTISGRQVTILRLLRALQDPEISVVALEDLVKQEPALTYRLLRTVNSAGFGQHRTVDSIRHALVLLGLNTIRRWAMLWAIAGLSSDARSELMTMATIRARCCELLADRLDGTGSGGEGFLVGMCSLFEVILGCPLTEVLDHLALSEGARAALLGEDTPMKRRLDAVAAYERGEWDDCHRLAAAAGIDAELVSACYTEAMRWANHLDLTNDRS